MSPTFSVIIPTLRREEQLRATLAGLAACDPLPGEVIIVDADPESSTESLVGDLRELGVKVQVLASPRGVSRQRNIGIAHATGDLIVFLDDDVLVDSALFAVAGEIFEDATIVAASGRVIEPRSRRVLTYHSKIRRFLPGGKHEGRYTSYGYPNYLRDTHQAIDVEFMHGCLMCVRRETAAAVEFDVRLALAEDEDFAYRLSRIGRVRHDPRLVVNHRKLGFLSRDRREADRSLLVSRRYIFRKNFEQRPIARFQFGALAVGLVVHRLINLDFQGALGILDSIRWAISNRTSANDGSLLLRSGLDSEGEPDDLALLRLFHPDGHSVEAGVVDSPSQLGRPLDFILFRPGLRWLTRRRRKAVTALAQSAAPDAVLYVVASPIVRGMVGRALRRGGLRREAAFVHRPRQAPTRLLVPLDAARGRYAAEALGPSAAPTRLVSRAVFSRALRRPVELLAPGVGLLFLRPDGRRPFEWLSFAGIRPSVSDTLLLRPRAGARLLVFHGNEADPRCSVFVSNGDSGEGSRLAADAAAESAAAAGAIVPRLLAVGSVGRRTVLVESGVSGELGAAVLQRKPAGLLDVLEQITAWIERWHDQTAQVAVLTPDLARLKLLGPAEDLRALVGEQYIELLANSCEHLLGSPIPMVATHGDLTMWNVLLQKRSDRLGVVDWETGDPASLPVGDLVYAAVDASAAVDGYADRQAAFEQCFAKGGSLAVDLEARVSRVAEAAGAERVAISLSFHACWLQHARNERLRIGASPEGPFQGIARSLASGDTLVDWASLPARP
jgi:GT2 family glycosyltransferase